ncbi:MAG: hypothetical protein ACP5H2_10160 [Solirubrobacteraceae bacterium]
MATLVVSTALAIAPVASAKSVRYHGKFAGKASVAVSSSSDTIKSVSGKGGAAGLTNLAGSHGGGSISGSCALFKGTATLSGKSGKVKLVIAPSSEGCGQGATSSVKGSAKATGLSGRYKKTAGSVKFSGVFHRSTGKFIVTFAGTV